MTDEAKALVERLGQAKNNHVLCAQAIAMINHQAREIERLREALRFYANNKNYRYIIGVDCTSVDIDAGDTARAALGESHDQ